MNVPCQAQNAIIGRAQDTNRLVNKIIQFTKMQGLGNDFVVIAASDLAPALVFTVEARATLARLMCDRRFGIGGDGLIIMFDFSLTSDLPKVLRDENNADCHIGWIYVNGDGSVSDMCGNALRCGALWAHLNNKTQVPELSIATPVGKKEIIYRNADEITVNLGEPILQPQQIPIRVEYTDAFVHKPLGLENLKGTCVSMGNPHVVLFDVVADNKNRQAEGSENAGSRFPQNYLELAPQIQQLDMFPDGVNVEFATVESATRMRLFVYERGCGATLACASGACAAVVAGVLEKRIERKVDVQLPGGCLKIEWCEADNQIRVTGPARVSFSGIFDLSTLGHEQTPRAAEAVCQ